MLLEFNEGLLRCHCGIFRPEVRGEKAEGHNFSKE
jgi:hypothetical protein